LNRGKGKRTVLHLACSTGNADIVKMLLSHLQIDAINQTDAYRLTAFALACESKLLGVIKVMLKYPRVDVNPVDQYNRSPLWEAISSGHSEVAKLIILSNRGNLTKSYGDLMMGDPYPYTSPMRLAELRRDSEIIKMMEKALYGKDKFRSIFNRLVGYVKENKVAKVEEILKNYVRELNLNRKFEQEQCFTLLHLACRNNSPKIVQLLLDQPKLDPNRANIYCYTPLHLACIFNFVSVAKLLSQDSRVDSDLEDDYDQSPFRHAILHGSGKVIKLFLRKRSGNFEERVRAFGASYEELNNRANRDLSLEKYSSGV